jgi:uncharacterized membrane protein YebE (DUF533 family)
MKASESANRLKELINKAIDEHTITRSDYDAIINIATEDGHIDSQERALLSNLQDMIDDRTIKIVAD